MKNPQNLLLFTEKLRKCLSLQLVVLKKLAKHNFIGRAEEVKILLASACTTGTAIFELGKRPDYFYAEMMMLGRSFIEKLTNFCYLNVCDSSEYEKFLIHPFYRMYHNFDRSKRAGGKSIGLRFSGKNSLRNDPKIVKALSTFSETDPRKNWSEKNIDQKVAIIAAKTNIDVEFFLINTLSIYSNASEALHGSLYGCAFHIGVFDPNIDHRNQKTVENNLLKNTALLFAQLSSMINEVIKFLSQESQSEPLLKDSNNISQQTVELMEKIFGDSKSA